MDNGICYIFGAGEKTTSEIQLMPNDYVIAADGGFDYLLELGLRADLCLGDFDSVVSYNLPSDSIRYPREKDDTDMMLAIKYGLQKGYTEFRIYGGLGGRLDHSLANLQALTYISKKGASGTLFGNGYNIKVVTNNTISFGKDLKENTEGNICSVFALSEICKNVTIKGTKYEISDASLTNQNPMGISNEFTGKKAFFNVKSGTIAVLWYTVD